MRIRDVADRAGVSVATVSRVLNGTETVRPVHRDRVLKAVVELGYRPNRLARNLRKQKADAIGVIVSDIENPHFTQMVRVMEDAAYRSGYRVLLCNTDETAEKQSAYLTVLAAERVLGVILSPSNPDDPEISHLIDLDIPVVALDRAVSDPRADAVVADNVGASKQATEHLIHAGHTRIGFIGGDDRIETAAERLQGYVGTMRRAGLEPRSLPGDFRLEGGWRATVQMLDSLDQPTALIVANNLMALGALKAIRSRGLRIPDDIALVGIDDPQWAELVEPPLTVMAQPTRQMAEAAISLLFERVSGERKEARKMVFLFDLVVRGSSAGPRSASSVQPGKVRDQ